MRYRMIGYCRFKRSSTMSRVVESHRLIGDGLSCSALCACGAGLLEGTSSQVSVLMKVRTVLISRGDRGGTEAAGTSFTC